MTGVGSKSVVRSLSAMTTSLHIGHTFYQHRRLQERRRDPNLSSRERDWNSGRQPYPRAGHDGRWPCSPAPARPPRPGSRPTGRSPRRSSPGAPAASPRPLVRPASRGKLRLGAGGRGLLRHPAALPPLRIGLVPGPGLGREQLPVDQRGPALLGVGQEGGALVAAREQGPEALQMGLQRGFEPKQIVVGQLRGRGSVGRHGGTPGIESDSVNLPHDFSLQ